MRAENVSGFCIESVRSAQYPSSTLVNVCAVRMRGKTHCAQSVVRGWHVASAFRLRRFSHYFLIAGGATRDDRSRERRKF